MKQILGLKMSHQQFNIIFVSTSKKLSIYQKFKGTLESCSTEIRGDTGGDRQLSSMTYDWFSPQANDGWVSHS